MNTVLSGKKGENTMKKFKDWYKEVSGKEFPSAAAHDDYEDNRAIAGQLRKIAQEIDALLA